MAFGLSISDFRLAFTTLTWIHEKCFTRAQGAGKSCLLIKSLSHHQHQFNLKHRDICCDFDLHLHIDVQYLRFGREIQSFASNLQSVVEVTENATEKRPPRRWGNHDNEYRQALEPLTKAVGDFQATIKECQKLLNDHNRFQRNAAGFIDNVQWHMGTQRDVDILRERVQFHSTKLLVLTKPFELHLLLQIRHELQELRREVQEIRGLLITVLANGRLPDAPNLNIPLPDVPQQIAQRFQDEASRRDGQDTSFGTTNEQLVEGFDALVYHFARSTVDFNPLFQNVPEETQYVNLLKSKWIIDKLEGSPCLRSGGQSSFWASYLQELKADIVQEYTRFRSGQLVAPSEDSMTRLPDSCFTIWVEKAHPLRPPDLAERRYEEERVLQLTKPESTGLYSTILTIFKRSPIEFRFVSSTKHLGDPGNYQEATILNTDIMRIVPAYAAPNASPSAHNILLSSSHVKDQQWQELSSFDDVKALQHVLTGYRVHHSMTNVSWSFTGSSKAAKSGKATLQLWQRQVLQDLDSDGASFYGTKRNSTTSPNAKAHSRQVSTASSTAATFVSGSSATSTVNGSKGDATAVLMPDPPILMLFTECDNRYAFIHLELHPDIFVDTRLCDCRKLPKKECQVAIVKSNTKYMQIRRYCTRDSTESDLDAWDLARFRMPRHPGFDEVELVPKVEYLRLQFHGNDGEQNQCS